MLSSRTPLFRTLGFVALPALLGLAVPSCITPPDYPDTPEIEFRSVGIKSIIYKGNPIDSVGITIGYRDGDGDLGSDDQNLLNYFCQAQIRQTDGSYVNYIPPGDAVNGFNGRYPNLTPESQKDRKAPLRGELSYFIPFSPISSPPPGTVLRFKVYILGRALHRSNEVTTDPITIPQ